MGIHCTYWISLHHHPARYPFSLRARCKPRTRERGRERGSQVLDIYANLGLGHCNSAVTIIASTSEAIHGTALTLHSPSHNLEAKSKNRQLCDQSSHNGQLVPTMNDMRFFLRVQYAPTVVACSYIRPQPRTPVASLFVGCCQK